MWSEGAGAPHDPLGLTCLVPFRTGPFCRETDDEGSRAKDATIFICAVREAVCLTFSRNLEQTSLDNEQ